ncbi:hypothetical protein DEO23_10210 [Brachybacterium endophyticum]|uniref:Uncharacterized protein n=1 Tax=Brachybacterium endophyticum TaxID=2182385 RepID=A0A2U2RK33_9MICO|nr:hypothetical protein [Brachybacterium endophyticum]PWH06165.1 hypothetical protein DEO23_10210 [Brachybacterium endophyticum]
MQWLCDWLTAPPSFSILGFVVLAALCILGTIGFAVWVVLAREEPDVADAEALQRITARDESAAQHVHSELNGQTGRGRSTVTDRVR